jgi:hypothetical protein
MQDIYLKVGMVVVAVAVMGLLIAFAFNAMNAQNPEADGNGTLSGTTASIDASLKRMCGKCIKQEYSGLDCFVVNVIIQEGSSINVSRYASPENFIILSGAQTLKLYNNGSSCAMRII